MLIAADEIDLAEALAAFLERSQFRWTTVQDGEAAYDYSSTGDTTR
jgi:DNA-binding response OmpR family regulator